MRAHDRRTTSVAHSALWLLPAALTLAYPFLLHAFSRGVGSTGLPEFAAWLCLVTATCVPFIGLVWAYRMRAASEADDFRMRARLLALITIASPPLFVFIGVTRGLIGRPFTDETVWLGVQWHLLKI